MASDGEISDKELLIDILMLGAFINTPMKDGVCGPMGIGQTELQILMALEGTGVLAGHDLVEILGIAPMNVSRALRQLRDQGLIEDAPDQENRRRRPVRLTKEGLKVHQGLSPAFGDVATALLASLTQSQKNQFSKSTRRVLRNMANWITSHHSEVHWSPPER